MNKEQKLKAITEAIRVKLPRLKQLEKGCFVEFDTLTFEVINSTDRTITVFDGGLRVENYLKSKLDFFYGFKIIGKEPMLNDVLEWLRGKNHAYWGYDIDSSGNLSFYDFYERKWINTVVYWDLSQPYLKDQSEKLINFLYELL